LPHFINNEKKKKKYLIIKMNHPPIFYNYM
jgi:hypothetical protein